METWKRIEIAEMRNKTITILVNLNELVNQANRQIPYLNYIMGKLPSSEHPKQKYIRKSHTVKWVITPAQDYPA